MTTRRQRAENRFQHNRGTMMNHTFSGTGFRMEGRFGPPDPAVVRKQQVSLRNKKVKVTLPRVGDDRLD